LQTPPPLGDPDRRLRTGRTRRGFLLAGLALAVGAIAVPFLPGKKSKFDPRMLFDLGPATANKKLLRDLCLAIQDHPNAAVRYEVARVMAAFPGDRCSGI